MDTLVQWRHSHARIQLFADTDKPGGGTMTLVVPDMVAARSLPAAHDIDTGAVSQGDDRRIAHFQDPDGNDIVLAEPPARMPAA